VQKDARVTCFRELSGTAGLSGRDLPPDEALAAMASVNARAQQYEDSGAFGGTRMDVLRAYAYLDLIKGTPAETRIAYAEAQDEAAEAAEGYAIGHGCARPDRSSRSSQAATSPGASPAGLPARLNLTVPATDLAGLPGSAGGWALVPRGSTGPPGGADPPDGYGTWTLILPGGRRFTVRLDPVPIFECDHRYESHGYQPSDKLRHMVQVRDGTCTFPTCNRHARESDFEHALPYDKGGKTCTCNAGARSRACHRVKQSKGWNVTQPKPGWHQWETPAGRVYLQEPWRYPA
jgi:hypothetical protein